MNTHQSLIEELVKAADPRSTTPQEEKGDLLDRAADAIRSLRQSTGRRPAGNVTDTVDLLDDAAHDVIAGDLDPKAVTSALADAAIVIRDLDKRARELLNFVEGDG